MKGLTSANNALCLLLSTEQETAECCNEVCIEGDNDAVWSSD